MIVTETVLDLLGGTLFGNPLPLETDPILTVAPCEVPLPWIATVETMHTILIKSY